MKTLSPADLVPLLCENCGSALQGGDEAAVFLCSVCGLAYEPVKGELASFRPLTATATTELAVGGAVQYLAFWRLKVDFSPAVDSAWTRLRKAKAPGSVYLYVPAFTLARDMMQRIGVSLAEAQPDLELAPGLARETGHRPPLVEVGALKGPGSAGLALIGPDFGTLSPVVVGRTDCHVLAHFIFLAVESYEAPNLRSVEYRLETLDEELLFLPAVWDPRYASDSNWRLLLSEFDDRVA
jgi:hypothetical protein